MVAFPYGRIGVLREVGLSAMADTARITRRATGVLDVNTGLLTMTALPALWQGGCKIEARGTVSRDAQVGDVQARITEYDASLPLDAAGFDVGDYLTVMTSQANTGLVGMPLEIIDIPLATWPVVRRLVLRSTHRARGV